LIDASDNHHGYLSQMRGIAEDAEKINGFWGVAGLLLQTRLFPWDSAFRACGVEVRVKK
jgi:hypothetical protein